MTPSRDAPEAELDATSLAMRSVVQKISTIAPHDVPVIFRGESGAGKSVLARMLHATSPRRAQRFTRVDCRGLELDGSAAAHVLARRLDEAIRGSILLEEVSALPGQLQAALAQLLEELYLAPRAAAHARIIATSCRDLEADVQSERFREGLLARLSVIEIRVPPLRDRKEDILALANRFVNEFARGEPRVPPELTLRAQRALLAYAWPGNVRELRNAMQRAVILGDGPRLDLGELPPKVSAAARSD
jgi:DNA-binding NtrC family response regulator